MLSNWREVAERDREITSLQQPVASWLHVVITLFPNRIQIQHQQGPVPIVYAMFALMSATLSCGTSMLLELPLWLAAQLTWIGASVGMAVMAFVVLNRYRDEGDRAPEQVSHRRR